MSGATSATAIGAGAGAASTVTSGALAGAAMAEVTGSMAALSAVPATAGAGAGFWSTVGAGFGTAMKTLQEWGGLIGGGVAALGAMSSAQGEQQRMDLIAKIQRQQADRERELGKLEAARIRDEGSGRLARTRALLAGRGQDPGEGSALLVQENLAEDNAFDEALALAGADTRAHRLEQDATLAKMEGRSAKRSGYYRAATSLATPFMYGAKMPTFG